MKKGLFLLIIGIILSVSGIYAQDVPAGVIAAFKKGSSEELAKYLGDNVELVIMNKTSNGDKAAAENTMSTFFTQNKVSSFNVNHQGKKGESSFVIGSLNSATGKFRINCFLKKIGNQYLIHQIRIDKTNE